jgi:hypothetical protein
MRVRCASHSVRSAAGLAEVRSRLAMRTGSREASHTWYAENVTQT